MWDGQPPVFVILAMPTVYEEDAAVGCGPHLILRKSHIYCMSAKSLVTRANAAKLE